MSSARLEPGREGELVLVGDLGFESVGALLHEGLRQFGRNRQWVVDMAGVGRANSAGLALLLEWLDHGRQQGVSLRFRHLPPSLEAIAQVSNVLHLLPLESSHPDPLIHG